MQTKKLMLVTEKIKTLNEKPRSLAPINATTILKFEKKDLSLPLGAK